MTTDEVADGASFDWFTEFVDNWLGLCVAFAKGRSWREMIQGFGVASSPATKLSFEEAMAPAPARLRAGTIGDWGYTVEHFTALGASEPVLTRLSSEGREAFSLAYSQTIDVFMFAHDGQLVGGFDMTVPHVRFGSEPHLFDDQISRIGFGASGGLRTPAMGAELVQALFGITLTPQLLEAPLPAVDLP